MAERALPPILFSADAGEDDMASSNGSKREGFGLFDDIPDDVIETNIIAGELENLMLSDDVDTDKKRKLSIYYLLEERPDFEQFRETKPSVVEWLDTRLFFATPKKELLYKINRIRGRDDTERWLCVYDKLNGKELNGFLEVFHKNKSKYVGDRYDDITHRPNTFIETDSEIIESNQRTDNISQRLQKVPVMNEDRPPILKPLNSTEVRRDTGAIPKRQTRFNFNDSSIRENSQTRPKPFINNPKRDSFDTKFKSQSIVGQTFNQINPTNATVDLSHLVDALQNITINTQSPTKAKLYTLDKDPDIWLKSYERTCIVNKCNDSQRVQNFCQNVCDEVISWFSDHFYNIDLNTISWTSLKFAFIREFQSPGKKLENCMRLNQLRQGQTESVRNYFRRANELCSIVDEQMSDKSKVSSVLYGLRDDIRNHILNLGQWPLTDDLHILMDQALSAESIIEINAIISNKNRNKPFGDRQPRSINYENRNNKNYVNNRGENKGQFKRFDSNRMDRPNRTPGGSGYVRRSLDYSNRDQRTDDIRKCFRCGSTEHIIYHCPYVFENENLTRWFPKALQNEKKGSENFRDIPVNERSRNSYQVTDRKFNENRNLNRGGPGYNQNNSKTYKQNSQPKTNLTKTKNKDKNERESDLELPDETDKPLN